MYYIVLHNKQRQIGKGAAAGILVSKERYRCYDLPVVLLSSIESITFCTHAVDSFFFVYFFLEMKPRKPLYWIFYQLMHDRHYFIEFCWKLQ